MSPLTFAVSLRSLPTPVIAVLGSGLDPSAQLPFGARILAARSFVDASPWDDPVGAGTAAAITIARSAPRCWGRDGAPEVHLLVAKVSAPDGTLRKEALARAMRWVRSYAMDLGIEVEGPSRALTRSLAERRILLLPCPGLPQVAEPAPWRHAA